MTSSADPGPGRAGTFDLDSRLIQLRAREFQFYAPQDANGEIVSLVSWRGHDDVIDVVQIDDENDARAARIPGDEDSILAPTRVLWETTGSALSVLDEVLALPDRAGLILGANTSSPHRFGINRSA